MTTSSGRALACRVLGVLGVVLSAYAVYVEHRVTSQRANPLAGAGGEVPFVALCDLGGWASCSDVLTSPSSRLFGPPNAALGVLFYIAIILYPSFTFVPFREHLMFMAVAFSCALTLYLGRVLLQMGDFCILCVSTYVINWTLLLVALRELRATGGTKFDKNGKAVRRAPAPNGGRATRVLGVLGALAAVWVSLVSGAVDSSSWLSPAAFSVVQTLPLWALVSFGAFSLASIGWALLRFRDCPQAAKELEGDIATARKRLEQRGFKNTQAQ